ncbi:MAG: DUF1553 domain-containing protein [Verrucomicrobiales bacterium]|nr:DUF1553 domain-containing protein [Verrucomicrobiales bacterium]
MYLAGTAVGIGKEVDFVGEVRPILSRHCGACHGADAEKRKADLRLDTKEGLLDPAVVVPRQPDASELWMRVSSEDPDEVMPPPKHGASLSAEEVSILKKWIEEGAPYAGHWAFEPVKIRPLPTDVSGEPWAKGGMIDAWVLHHLKERGWRPSEPASPEQWLRRVTLDLTGLPPTLEELEAFLKDSNDDARARVVDRLLATQAFAEQMASSWLDVARLGDTYGRHEDADCVTWPYRDWVIQAFDRNLPYDDFIRWQTAGDLMPNATREMRVATAFNRLSLQSNEAGSNPEEFRMAQVADRVTTNATAFLGLTLECARCHDHKYDPLTMRDFYSFSAFFNNIDELGLFAVFTGGVPTPTEILYDEGQMKRRAEILDELADLEQRREAVKPEAEKRYQEWLKTHQPPRPVKEKGLWAKMTGWFQKSIPEPVAGREAKVWMKFETASNKELVNELDQSVPCQLKNAAKTTDGRLGKALVMLGDNAAVVGGAEEVKRTQPFTLALWVEPKEKWDRAVVVHRSRAGVDAACRGLELILDEMRPSFALVHFSPGDEVRVRARQAVPVDQWTHLACTYDGSSRAAGMKIYVNGVAVETEVIRDGLKRDIVYRTDWGDEDGKDGGTLDFAIGWRFNDSAFRNGLVDEFYYYPSELTEPEVRLLALLEDRDDDAEWFAWYLGAVDPEWLKLTAQIAKLREEENEMSGHAVELMVMKEMDGPRRPTHLLARGQFDQPLDLVEPNTPAVLPPFPKDAPRNRLGLAQWLTSPENPLTPRVAVNRFWQQFFGEGLVVTAEDFGAQGQPPAQPELLDALAAEFVQGGWNVKALCREIVLSNTYAQAGVPEDLKQLEEDPHNAHLARGPRRRMSAEEVRDSVLAEAGLLVAKVGGSSVRPYQPAGLWTESGTQHSYLQDHGADLYRRSMYSFWRRTLPPASLAIFDSPTREYCRVRRTQTSTPMQALVLMNDVQFVEAARVLAERLVRAHPGDEEGQVVEAFRRLTSERPNGEQTRVLTAFLKDELARAARQTEAERTAVLANGEVAVAEDVKSTEVVAATMMVRLLLGYTETTTIP